jgi:hypothetical protein
MIYKTDALWVKKILLPRGHLFKDFRTSSSYSPLPLRERVGVRVKRLSFPLPFTLLDKIVYSALLFKKSSI